MVFEWGAYKQYVTKDVLSFALRAAQALCKFAPGEFVTRSKTTSNAVLEARSRCVIQTQKKARSMTGLFFVS